MSEVWSRLEPSNYKHGWHHTVPQAKKRIENFWIRNNMIMYLQCVGNIDKIVKTSYDNNKNSKMTLYTYALIIWYNITFLVKLANYCRD